MITVDRLNVAHELFLNKRSISRAERRRDAAIIEASAVESAHVGTQESEPALYVSTNLKSWPTEDATGLGRDLGLNGTCYRRLDPTYYSWLRQQVVAAKNAMKAGKIKDDQFHRIAMQFREIHDWAIAHFGKPKLDEAVAAFQTRANLYRAPSMDWLIRSGFEEAPRRGSHGMQPDPKPAYLFPAADEEPWRCWTRVPTGALAKVRAIESEALALGWSKAALYQNRGVFKFPIGKGYGLICFVKEKDRIGKVTTDFIEIVKPPPSRSVLRFTPS